MKEREELPPPPLRIAAGKTEIAMALDSHSMPVVCLNPWKLIGVWLTKVRSKGVCPSLILNGSDEKVMTTIARVSDELKEYNVTAYKREDGMTELHVALRVPEPKAEECPDGGIAMFTKHELEGGYFNKSLSGLKPGQNMTFSSHSGCSIEDVEEYVKFVLDLDKFKFCRTVYTNGCHKHPAITVTRLHDKVKPAAAASAPAAQVPAVAQMQPYEWLRVELAKAMSSPRFIAVDYDCYDMDKISGIAASSGVVLEPAEGGMMARPAVKQMVMTWSENALMHIVKGLGPQEPAILLCQRIPANDVAAALCKRAIERIQELDRPAAFCKTNIGPALMVGVTRTEKQIEEDATCKRQLN